MRQTSYYGKLCTIMYDLDKPYAPKDELSLYKRYLVSKEMSILEPMCGSGRFYVPLLQEGYKIDGFDISGDMLQACADKCARLGLRPNIWHGDVTAFTTDKKYDLIFIPAGSICLLTKERDLLACLRNMQAHLADQGRFLVSFLNKSAKLDDIDDWVETKRKPVGDAMLIEYWKLRYLADSEVLDYKLHYELLHNGVMVETESMDFPIKIYDEIEFKTLLTDVGFREIQQVRIEGEESTLSEDKMTILQCAC